jgi:DNA primase
MGTLMTQLSEDKKLVFKTKLQCLKEAVDPRYLVESLGIKIFKETPKELRGCCPIHGGDNVTSFRFNKHLKTWVCFSHKCHDVFGNDVLGLIMGMNKVGFMEAVAYLQDLVGGYDSVLGAKYRQERERKEFINYNTESNYVHPKVNEERLVGYLGYRSDLFRDEGFTEEVLDYFEIGGGYRTGDGLSRDVIPIRGVDNKLLAYSLRDPRSNVDYESKYWITPGFNKDSVLYNLNNIVPLDKPLILVEGFKSVWRLRQYGINNSACIMGSKVTPGQQSLLYTYAMKGVVLFFDNDLAGVSGALDAYHVLSNKIDVDVVFITEVDENGDGLDPADLTYEEVYSYLRSYV